MNLTPIIKESFSQYAGAVLQSRALVDVRDCLKPSARQIFYCLHTDNFIYSKPFKKTLKAIGSAMRMYIHGDSSCEGVIMRAGQPFAMRYPLVEVEGSYGNLIESGNWAASRYTSARLSKLASYLFSDINKNTISEWRDNYDDTEKYPTVLSTKGFYNIVNGTAGIGVGAASSIPSFNLREVNEALIKLLWNPDISFEDIYCAPDFATGATILNEEEVKESLKNGTGRACKIRSTIEFDQKERCLIITEIPYAVYTNTICGELEEILNKPENPGIDRFNDLTGATPLIKIYLTKAANVNRVIKYLYKNTSLQYYYSINMTMLEDGRYPKVFGWKEILQSHINHEKIVYRRSFEYDLNKINERLHIINGLLKAIDMIDEVIKTIKSSSNTNAASIALQQLLNIDEKQAKAILDIKLSRLAHLEINKLVNEKEELTINLIRIEAILNDDNLLNKEIEKGFREVSEKFGDARRTKILNVEKEEDEPIEVRKLSLAFTNQGAVFVTETSSLYSQKRGGTGNKFKLDADEYIVDSIVGENVDTILFFGSLGNFYPLKMENFLVGEKQYLNTLIDFVDNEQLVAARVLNSLNDKKYIVFTTKNGLIKKSDILEYNLKFKRASKALKLDENDEIVSVNFVNNEKIGLLTYNGMLSIFSTEDVRSTGRTTRGVIGMKLSKNDYVISSRIIEDNETEILIATEDGYGIRNDITDFRTTTRGCKGIRIQKNRHVVDFLTFYENLDIMITSNTSRIVIESNTIRTIGKGSLGVRLIKLKEEEKVVRISKI